MTNKSATQTNASSWSISGQQKCDKQKKNILRYKKKKKMKESKERAGEHWRYSRVMGSNPVKMSS